MTWTLLQAVVGLVTLYFGGESLVRGASALAARLGVSSLAIGLTVVAFGTSAPELVVSLDAALSGANDISVGNVVGSNIANIALILGLATLIRPTMVEAKIVRIDIPIMILASLGLYGALVNETVSRIEGTLFLLCLIVYIFFTFWEARQESSNVRKEFASLAPEVHTQAWVSILLVVTGIVLLVVGGHVLVNSAVDLATALGINQATIGLTIVAIGTSLPEFATSVIASIRRQGDIAVGNVVGSNIFNILGIIGITACVQPLHLGGITWFDLGVMTALACALSLMFVTRRCIGRVEGIMLLVSYVGYSIWLLAT